MAGIHYIQEDLSEEELEKFPDALPMEKAIAKLRDEITGLLMLRYRGQSRELSMCLARLDEARLWAIAEKEKTKEVVIVDRAGGLRSVTTDTPDAREPAHV